MSTTTATEELILQGARAWLKATGSRGGLTDAQVIPADDKGPRPSMPYLTLKLTASDIQVGEDELVNFLGDLLTITGGAEGDEYAITVNGEDLTYERLEADTDADVAEALAERIGAALDLVYAEAVGGTLWIAALTGDLQVETADPKLELEAGGVVVQGIMAVRTANLSVQSFGVAAAAWVERAASRLSMEDGEAVVDEAGLSIVPNGGMLNVSAMLDTKIEGRTMREFTITYATRQDPLLLTPLESMSATITLERSVDDPDGYVITVEQEV